METYKKLRASGIEWVGNIPEHWDAKKLKFIADIITGNTPPKAEEDNYSEIGFPWIKPDNLKGLELIYDSKEKLSEKGLQFARLVPKDAILVCCIGTIGKMGVAGCDLTTNQQINSLVFENKLVDTSFSKYVIFSSEKEHLRQSNKVVVSILNKDGQSNIYFPLPSLPEQKAIASFLDEKTKQIDTLIEKKQKMIELLKEERQAVINEAVTKGIHPKAKMKDSGIEWLEEIPEHWDVKRLKYLVQLTNVKKGFDESLLRIENENIESWTGKYIETETVFAEKEELKSFKKGDVLFNKLRPYLAKVFLAKSEGYSGGELLILRPLKNIESRFLYYRTLSDSFIRVVNSSTEGAKMPRADWEFIGQLRIPFPSLEEQKSISNLLDGKIEEFEKVIEKAEKAIELLQEYRTALITEVVTGKVCVISG